MPRPRIEDLHDPNRFELVADLDHANLVGAVQNYLFRASPVTLAYLFANLLVLGWVIILWRRTSLPFFEGFSQFSLGIVMGYLALVAIHEHVHGLVYRLVGASNVRIIYKWRSLTAYCVVDRYVVNRKEFFWLAIMPFLAVDAVLALLVLLAPPSFGLFLGGVLLFHISACSGDIALINLLWVYRPAEIFTYDDMTAQHSYFFRPSLKPPSD